MIWWLLVAYQAKHWLADYPLQGRYMLGKFKPFPECVVPLLAHASVHGAFTFAIASAVKPHLALALALFDMTVHGTMDFIKANPKLMGRWHGLSKNEMRNILSYEKTIGLKQFAAQLRGNKFFWWALGIDQLVHHLTHYAIIAVLVG